VRRLMPRFQGENFTKNLELVARVKEIATARGGTPGQLALAWVHARGKDVFPIPGTKRRKYLEENVAAFDVDLSVADLAALDRAMPADAVSGLRYPEPLMRVINL
jgi:aryl-alcohol dehydrogenase-like predicted oxidoreductase